MNARDELNRTLIFARDLADPDWSLSVPKPAKDVIRKLVAALEVGRRTIATVGDLNSLGRMATVLDANGCVWVNDGDHAQPWASFTEDPQGGPVWADGGEVTLPATVLYEPEPQP